MAKQPNPPIDLDDMITHDELLERYTWLSGQIVNRWKRKRGLRYFRGAKGLIVYVLSDVVRCLNEEMNEGVVEPREEQGPLPAASPPAAEPPREPSTAGRPEMTEADQIRERLFLEKLKGKKK